MKKKPLWLVLFLVLTATGTICAEVLIKPNDANINYYGRFDLSNSSSVVKFNWPGSIIEASFPGPSIGVELNDGGGSYFNVEIDGVLLDSLAPTTNTHRSIKTDLSTTVNHTIRITLRSNGWQTCSFGGFYLQDGKKLSDKPVKPSRKIEFIGDSWTAGNVMLQTSGADNQKYYNAARSYARLTSQAFHAQDMLVARGGCGLVKSNGSDANMPTRYPKTLCDGTTTWDFTSWIPDLVVIFLGINDFNNGVTDAYFKTAYTSFITTVRSHYQNVPIILIGLAGNVLTDVQSVAQSFSKVYTYSSPVTLANAKALWMHPDVAQHRQIADGLIPVVKQATGWDTVPPVSVEPVTTKQITQHITETNTSIIKTPLGNIVFDPMFSGMLKEVSIYNCSGRLVGKCFTLAQNVMVTKEFGIPPGVYIVKKSILK